MFNAEEDARFSSTDSEEWVFDHIEDVLSDLGRVRITSRGDIDIRPRASFDNSFCQTALQGRVRQRRNGDYDVRIKIVCSLTALGWVLLILALFIAMTGVLLLLIPMQKKDEVARKVRRTLRELEEDD